MSEAAGSADARKRPFDLDPSDLPSNQPKKAKTKKLSSIARRALLALESDDDGSSSDDGGDVRGFEDQTAGEEAGEPAIHLEGNVALTDRRTNTTRKASDDVGGPEEPIATDNDKGEMKSSIHHCPSKYQDEKKIGSRLSEDADIRDEVEITDVSAELLSGATKENVTQRHNNKDKSYDDEVGLITESDSAVATDEDVVHPHAPASEYNDILSFFLSTPFDDKAMMALHKSKEVSGRARKGHAKKKAINSKVISQVPILPQKEFIKGVKEKKSAQRGESLQNATNGGTNSISSDAIRAEVISFLILEGQKMMDSSSAIPVISNKPQTSFQYPPAPGNQQPPTQQSPHQHLLPPNQQMTPSNYYGFTQQQNSYYPNATWNSYRSPPQIHHGYPHTNNWQLLQHATAARAPAPVFPSAPGAVNANKACESPAESQRIRARNAAQSAEPAGPDFPDGWTAKTFERTTPNQGRTGTYKIWFSPMIKAKFRSMRSARIFLEILSEPDIDGDEHKAFEVFKSRGGKM